MKRALAFLLVIWSTSAFAQFQWWNDIHNWDGYTPWNQYFTYSHAFLGPNALPIPTLSASHENYAMSSAQVSLRGDDQFLNWHNELQLITGKTRFVVIHQSIEAFRTTTEVRDRRASRGESGQGVQAGDVLVNISHELLANEQWDLYFTTYLKTAAGPLNNARFTDAPGYAFFFSANYRLDNKNLVFSSDAGFQVYQTFWTEYPQNDGFLMNVRATKSWNAWELQGGVRSFTGYFRQGDWPRIADLELAHNGDHGKTALKWTAGLNDYPFSFLTISHRLKL